MANPTPQPINTRGTLRGIVQIGDQFYRKKIRVYTANMARTAAAGAPFSGTININPTTLPFMLQKIHVNDTTDSNTMNTQQDMFLGITDNESGYNWTDGLVPRATLAGDRVFGYTLPEELPIRGNTKISITGQNPAVAPSAGTCSLSLIGYELWPL
jgi:hypothetical protein